MSIEPSENVARMDRHEDVLYRGVSHEDFRAHILSVVLEEGGREGLMHAEPIVLPSREALDELLRTSHRVALLRSEIDRIYDSMVRGGITLDRLNGAIVEMSRRCYTRILEIEAHNRMRSALALFDTESLVETMELAKEYDLPRDIVIHMLKVDITGKEHYPNTVGDFHTYALRVSFGGGLGAR